MGEVKEVCENDPYSVRHKVAKFNQVFHIRRYADRFVVLAYSCKENTEGIYYGYLMNLKKCAFQKSSSLSKSDAAYLNICF